MNEIQLMPSIWVGTQAKAVTCFASSGDQQIWKYPTCINFASPLIYFAHPLDIRKSHASFSGCSVPIYQKHQLLHIHIPKTGGTAIGRHFDDHGDAVWNVSGGYGVKLEHGRWFEYQHASLKEIHWLTNYKFAHYKSFAVVRHPIDRLISEFKWRKSIKSNNKDSFVISFDRFDDFLAAIPTDIDSQWNELVTQAESHGQANFLIHARPQYQHITNDWSCSEIDLLLRFENLRRDFEAMIDWHHETPTKIATPKAADRSEFISAKSARLIEKLYETDFELFYSRS